MRRDTMRRDTMRQTPRWASMGWSVIGTSAVWAERERSAARSRRSSPTVLDDCALTGIPVGAHGKRDGATGRYAARLIPAFFSTAAGTPIWRNAA